MNQRSGEQVLAELRRDVTDAPPEAMDRMRYAVQRGTAHHASPARTRMAAARGPRLLRPAVVGGVAAGLALAVAGGVVAVNATGKHPSGGTSQASGGPVSGGEVSPPPRAGGPTGRPPVLPANPQALLGQVALAAQHTALAPRDDQFIYTATVGDTAFLDGAGRITRRFRGTTGRVWVSVDGSRPGWSDDIDKLGHPSGGPLPPPSAAEVGLRAPTYKFLTTLPTDPDALLAMIRRSVHVVATSKPHAIDDENQAAFAAIGDLLGRGVLPPGLATALYRAAAKIPGIRIEPNAVDAAGRHGIGVARSLTGPAMAPGEGGPGIAPVTYLQWIFDAKDHRLLGEVEKSAVSTNSVAITRIAVVDHARQLPG